jgi:cytochrome c oxidase cbb3-type subunit IV
MDINDLRIVITTLSFVVFAGIVIWAYSGRQRARFDEAANLPFADAELPGEVALKPEDNSAGVHS